MMNIIKISLLALLVSPLMGLDIEGTWIMTTWEGKDTAQQEVKYLELTFGNAGEIKSFIVMSEKWGYTQLIGSGTYKVMGDKIEWNHGQGHGSTEFKIKNRILEMNPDILLRGNGGKIPGRGRYIKRQTP